jgi:hypothetical protein
MHFVDKLIIKYIYKRENEEILVKESNMGDLLLIIISFLLE